jgi:hypothetical protein
MPRGSHEKVGKHPEQRSDTSSSAHDQSPVERYGFEWTDNQGLPGRGIQGSSSDTITQNKYRQTEIKEKERKNDKIKELDKSVDSRMKKMTKLYNEVKDLLKGYQEDYSGQHEEWLGSKEKDSRDILSKYDSAKGFKEKKELYNSFRDLTQSMESWIKDLQKT